MKATLLSRPTCCQNVEIGQAGSLTFVPLLQRVRRHDFDTFDYHAFRGLAHFALWISLDRRVADFLQNIIAFDQFAERRVLPIESPNGARQMKNCEPAESGSGPRAIERTPRSWE